MDTSSHPLVFVHLPKTAGITLWMILQRQYSAAAVYRSETIGGIAVLTPEQRQGIRAYVGHFPFGAEAALGGPCTYVTMLRDPVERILSHFAHVVREAQRKPGHAMLGAHADSAADLERYLELGFGESDNAMTRALAGPEAQVVPCDRATFELAKHHLEERFAVVGLTERFDESLVLMQRQLGWRTPFYGRENIGPNRLPRQHFPASLVRAIEQQTQWDQELYRVAARELQRRTAAEGEAFTTALRRFQSVNAQYQTVKSAFYQNRLLSLKHKLPVAVQRRMETISRAMFFSRLS